MGMMGWNRSKYLSYLGTLMSRYAKNLGRHV